MAILHIPTGLILDVVPEAIVQNGCLSYYDRYRKTSSESFLADLNTLYSSSTEDIEILLNSACSYTFGYMKLNLLSYLAESGLVSHGEYVDVLTQFQTTTSIDEFIEVGT